jgi:bacteriorhodopsin
MLQEEEKKMLGSVVLSHGEFNLVYNALSFGIAAMGAFLVYAVLARNLVTVKNQLAVIITAIVALVALYHYLRIFNSWNAAFTMKSTGQYVMNGTPFNEAYRYVDWLLTVPMLLMELVIVLRLAREKTRSLIVRLVIASIAMIALGYPGEVASGNGTKLLFFTLSFIFFIYILYVLFVELSKSLDRQPASVVKIVGYARYVLVGTWLVYPLAFLAPIVISNNATSLVVRQVGYSIADILAKPLFGILVVAMAILKSKEKEAAELS